MELKEIEAFVNKIPDHPKPGILFYDISTLILDNEAFGESLRLMCDSVSKLEIDLVAGIDARGFIFGSAIAKTIKKPLILATNDDGIQSGFLKALVKELAKVGEVFVCAPDGERSWIGHAISRNQKLIPKKVKDYNWS